MADYFFQAMRFVLFFQLLTLAPTGWSMGEVQDSIRLDGEILLIDARVRFDSTDIQGFLTNDGEVQGTKSKPFDRGFVRAQLAFGLPEGSISGGSVGKWSRRPSVLYTFDVGSSHSISKKKGSLQELAFEWGVGFERLNALTLDVNSLPDSLIGFLPANNDGSTQGIVVERFAIGVETDTVPIQRFHQSKWRTSLRVGMTKSWKSSWFFHAVLGATVLLEPEDRVGLYEPDEDRGFAYSTVSLKAGHVIPFTDLGLSKRFAESVGNTSFSWSLGLNARIQPRFNSLGWLGVQVRYNWK
jgi:hypothetical protein